MAELTTANFQWKDVSQVRCGVSVSSVIKLIQKEPKPIQKIDLADWSVKTNGTKYAVCHKSGTENGFNPDHLPNDRQDAFPVLIGQGNGKQFLIDGAHRIAKALSRKRKTATAVILSEEETRKCVRGGQEKRFNKAIGL